MLSPQQEETLNQQKAIIELKKREERYMYYGIYQSYKSNETIIQKLDYTKLNPTQHFMFKRVLHGLNEYSKEEVAAMHWDKKRRIKKVWKRGQDTINEWKQVLANKYANAFFKVTFGEKSALVRDLLAHPVTDVSSDYRNRMTLKDLGITYEDVILRFMAVGLLPKNFLSIK